MKQQVFEFDKIRKQIKSSNSHNAPTILLQRYKTVSEELKNGLIGDYNKYKQINKSSFTSQTKHKLNVLKKVLSHEWNITI